MVSLTANQGETSMSELEKRHEDNPQPDLGRADGTSPEEAGTREQPPAPGGASLDLPLSSPD